MGDGIESAAASAAPAVSDMAQPVVESGDEATESPPVENKAARIEALLKDRVEKRRAAREEKLQNSAFSQREQALMTRAAEVDAREKKANELLAWEEEFKQSPVEALRKRGYEPTSIFNTIAQQGTYEGQLTNQLKELQAKIDEQSFRHQEFVSAMQRREQEHQEAVTAERTRQERNILQTKGKEMCPTAVRLWEPDEFESKCRQVAAEYCKKTGESFCPWEDLLSYMEVLASDKVKGFSAKEEAPVSLSAVPDAKSAKSITKKMSSERGTSPKPAAKMTEQEMRSEMLKVARAALGKK